MLLFWALTLCRLYLWVNTNVWEKHTAFIFMEENLVSVFLLNVVYLGLHGVKTEKNNNAILTSVRT
jgi:hypothetical protein